ncbi:zinc metalloproteinase nas-33-like isoform X2 [Alosa sapidissima]|uniref:zinc metalloproteinase nas-33-like isoform X2 n=1 Tax=Alosa sapidissima TaxID=34773 RepID=UPI001C084462|nr:zinc metalloproteinase nas-33-like isoform X2 [Alosa sapidissima]
MTLSQTCVLAIYVSTILGTLHFQPLLGKIPEVDPVVVRSGDDATLSVPGMMGILSATWHAPGGVILGLWAQGPDGGPSGVAYSHVPQYSGRVKITNSQLRISTVQIDDAGNYTVTVVTNSTSGITVSSVWVQVYEDTLMKHTVSEILEAANAGLDDISVAPVDQRNADPCTARGCTWEKSTDGSVYVPYVLGNEYSPIDRNLIQRAMASIQSSSCIRFRPRQTERDYLQIYSGTGCSSFVGRRGSVQQVSLQRPGCMFLGTIQHEFLHALGFNHEHQRSDRDKYVRIHLENVQSGKERNFEQVDTLNQNTPYDYSSVMHYHRAAFSKNGQATLVPIPNSSVPIGIAFSMSHNDFIRLNRLYECNALSVRLTIQSTAIEGESVILQCTWAGNQTSVTWRRNGVTLTPDSRIAMSEGILGISTLEREDAGEYSCTVSTAETTETTRATLIVHYKCLTLGGLIGIVIACFIVLSALCIAIVLLVKQRKAQQKVHTAYGVNIRNPNFMPYGNT